MTWTKGKHLTTEHPGAPNNSLIRLIGCPVRKARGPGALVPRYLLCVCLASTANTQESLISKAKPEASGSLCLSYTWLQGLMRFKVSFHHKTSVPFCLVIRDKSGNHQLLKAL